MRSQAIWHSASLAVYFRHELYLKGPVKRGVLRCAGSGPYAIYLNGALVGRGLGKEIAEDVVWEEFDLSMALQEGDNLLLIQAFGGGEGDWFRAEGEIGTDRERELNSSTSWQVQGIDAWQAMNDGVIGHTYVAALEPEEWASGRFRAEEWREARVVEGSEPRDWMPLVAVEEEVWARSVVEFGEVDSWGSIAWVAPAVMETAKCVRREALLERGKIQMRTQTRDTERAAYLVLDFGRVIDGFPRLRLRGRSGAVDDVGFARDWGAVESGLRYVSSEGWQEWTFPRIMACRYLVLRVSQCVEEVEVDSVSLVERRFEVEARGRFEAVGEDWDSIRRVGERTLSACRREVYALGWGQRIYDWEKFYVLAQNDFYATGCSDVARAVLASNEAPTGGVSACFYALFVELVQRHLGDHRLAIALLPDVLGGLEAVTGGGGSSTALGALRTGAWQAAAALCRAAGKAQQALECERVVDREREGLQAAWDEDRGLFADSEGSEDFTLRANGLVLYWGLAAEEQRNRVVEFLGEAQLAEDDDLWQAFFIASALWQAGEGERALGYMQRTWGALLESEGWTWGEKTGRLAAEPGVEALLGAYVLGVRTKAEGVLEIRPHLSGLERAEGVVPTAYGDIEMAWGAYSGGFSLWIALPHNGETHLAVPRRGKRFPQIAINGETVWRNEKVHPNFHVQDLISESEWVVLVLRKAGRYEVAMH